MKCPQSWTGEGLLPADSREQALKFCLEPAVVIVVEEVNQSLPSVATEHGSHENTLTACAVIDLLVV